MLFINLNLNLKQARISIQVPETICKNKIRLKVRRNGEITVNRIHKLAVGRNLRGKFAFSPPSLRQFSFSNVDGLFYSLNFIIDCDLEYSIGRPIDDQCTLSLPSDHEMATDWAYCCGDNQKKHLQSLRMTEDSRAGETDMSRAKASEAGLSRAETSETDLNKAESEAGLSKAESEAGPTGSMTKADHTANDSNHSNQQIYNLFAKQKLFTKFLVESSNRSEYLIIHKLGNPCLIAFDGAEDLFTTESRRPDEQAGEDASGDESTQEADERMQSDEEIDEESDEEREIDEACEIGEEHRAESDKSLRLELIESIFVEFIYLDYDQRPDEVKKYRHSFDYEFLKLDSTMFDGLFRSLHRVNGAVLPLAAKHNLSTRFNYSYLLSDYAKAM